MSGSGGTAPSFPGDVVLEPGERVLAVARRFPSWIVGIVVEVLVLAVIAGALAARAELLAEVAAAILVVVGLGIGWRVLQWSSRVWVLTDRRIIARWGVLSRHQSALLLDRIQDVSLGRPFPASLIADYGVLHFESAGEHSDDVVSEGLTEIAVTGASRFYRALTNAQTPGR